MNFCNLATELIYCNKLASCLMYLWAFCHTPIICNLFSNVVFGCIWKVREILGKILPICTVVVMLIRVELESNPPYCSSATVPYCYIFIATVWWQNFSVANDCLDTFLRSRMAANYPKVWAVCELALLLSHS